MLGIFSNLILLFLSRLEDMEPDMLISMDGNNDFYGYKREGASQYYNHPYQNNWIRATVDPGALAMFELFTRIFEGRSLVMRKIGEVVVTFFGNRSLESDRVPVEFPSLGTPEQERSFATSYAKFSNRSYMRVYRHLRAITQSAGVDLMIVLQPQLWARDRNSLTPIESELWGLLEQTELENQMGFRVMHRTAGELLADFAAGGDTLYLDAQKVLESHEEQAFTDYCHLTPSANEAVAKAMSERIHQRIARRLSSQTSQGLRP